jgi:hypothetical protein
MVSAKSAQKLGAAIYLESFVPLSVERFVADFRRRWTDTSCETRDQEADCLRFKIGRSHIAIEARSTLVPDGVTNSVLKTTVHWPTANADMPIHKAHIAVAATSDDGDAVSLASDLTKAVTSLLAITKAVCVCWLNGSVLMMKKDFIRTASELLGAGQPPFLLWVGLHWAPEGGLIHTKGMAQFGVPEIFLGQQSRVSKDAVAYLHHLVRHILTGGARLVEGDTIEGPTCIFKITSLEGVDNKKAGLLLWPVRPN